MPIEQPTPNTWVVLYEPAEQLLDLNYDHVVQQCQYIVFVPFQRIIDLRKQYNARVQWDRIDPDLKLIGRIARNAKAQSSPEDE